MGKKNAGNGIVMNVIRPSSSPADQSSLYGPSREYESEAWTLDYFSAEDGDAYKKSVRCFLPKGYEEAFLRYGDASRREGPIYKVRRWGVGFIIRYLEF